MNITKVDFSPFSSDNEIILPETVSCNLNEGAIVPKGIIVDGVADISIFCFNQDQPDF